MIDAHFMQVVAIITRPESRESFISNTFVFTFEVRELRQQYLRIHL
jgi:hypothetical protein